MAEYSGASPGRKGVDKALPGRVGGNGWGKRANGQKPATGKLQKL